MSLWRWLYRMNQSAIRNLDLATCFCKYKTGYFNWRTVCSLVCHWLIFARQSGVRGKKQWQYVYWHLQNSVRSAITHTRNCFYYITSAVSAQTVRALCSLSRSFRRYVCEFVYFIPTGNTLHWLFCQYLFLFTLDFY